MVIKSVNAKWVQDSWTPYVKRINCSTRPVPCKFEAPRAQCTHDLRSNECDGLTRQKLSSFWWFKASGWTLICNRPTLLGRNLQHKRNRQFSFGSQLHMMCLRVDCIYKWLFCSPISLRTPRPHQTKIPPSPFNSLHAKEKKRTHDNINRVAFFRTCNCDRMYSVYFFPALDHRFYYTSRTHFYRHNISPHGICVFVFVVIAVAHPPHYCTRYLVVVNIKRAQNVCRLVKRGIFLSPVARLAWSVCCVMPNIFLDVVDCSVIFIQFTGKV